MNERHRDYRQTEEFLSARFLTERQEIAKAFNLQDRVVLKLRLNVDEYGDRGNYVKIKVHHESRFNSFEAYDAYHRLEVRRFGDERRIRLLGNGSICIKSSFGLEDIEDMFNEHDCQTVKDGDKCVILVEDETQRIGYVMTGTLRLPKWQAGYEYSGSIEIDKRGE